MPNFYDALAGGYAPIPAPGVNPMQPGQGISPFLMAQQQPVGTQLQDIFMQALEAIVPQSNTAEGMPTAPPLPGAGGQFGPPQLAGAGMMVPGMPPPVAPGGSGGASAMMPPLPPAQNVGPPPTPMGLQRGMSAPPPRPAAPGAPAAGEPSEQSTWEQILSNPDLLEFGLRLMAASQPHGPGIVGPTFAGAVGEAGIGQIGSNFQRETLQKRQDLEERRVKTEEARTDILRANSEKEAGYKYKSALAQLRDDFLHGGFGDPKSPEARATFDQQRKALLQDKSDATSLMKEAESLFPDDPEARRNFIERVRLKPATEIKLSEGEKKGAFYSSRLQAASALIKRLEGQFNPASLGEAARGTFNVTATPEYRQYRQAAREWLAPVLRYESGAAIPETEFESYYQTYFPVAGDDEQTIANKTQARDVVQKAMLGTYGTAPGMEPSPSAGAAAGPAANSGEPVQITNDSEYEALPAGTPFTGPDRILRRKP